MPQKIRNWSMVASPSTNLKHGNNEICVDTRSFALSCSKKADAKKKDNINPFMIVEKMIVTQLELKPKTVGSERVLIARIDPSNTKEAIRMMPNFKTKEKPQESRFSSYKKIVIGAVGTLQHRVLIQKNGFQLISPWHDIPLFQDNHCLSFVCTTPRREWIHIEVGCNEIFSPLRVRCRDLKPTHFAQNAPHNYGFFPRTAAQTGLFNWEPIRVLDIGRTASRKVGDMYTVILLAAFLVADGDHSMSWHVVAIDSEDKRAKFARNAECFSELFPGVLDEISSWLVSRNNINAGDEDSVVAFGGKEVSQETLVRVIKQANASWKLKFGSNRDSKALLDYTRAHSAAELEKMWQLYTSHLSTENIDVGEPPYQSSLKYEKAWECVMGHEQQEESPQQSPWLGIKIKRSLTEKSRAMRQLSPWTDDDICVSVQSPTPSEKQKYFGSCGGEVQFVQSECFAGNGIDLNALGKPFVASRFPERRGHSLYARRSSFGESPWHVEFKSWRAVANENCAESPAKTFKSSAPHDKRKWRDFLQKYISFVQKRVANNSFRY